MKKIIAFLLLFPCLGCADQVLTPSERVIALTLLGEARGEGELGLFAVACVIQRRAWERKMTPAQVCLEKKQFSPWNGTDSQGNYRLKKERELYHLWEAKHKMYARQLARYLTRDYFTLGDVTNGANHFCNINANPYWAKGKKPVIIIGKHKFYKL